MEQARAISVDGVEYVWVPRLGLTSKNLKVPVAVAARILPLLKPLLEADDARLQAPRELAARAAELRRIGENGRAEALARRALRMDPRCAPAAATLSSLLRAADQPEEALRITEPFKMRSDPAILTTRAAALLDLGLWDQAQAAARRAWAVSKGRGSASEALHAVFGRIQQRTGSGGGD